MKFLNRQFYTAICCAAGLAVCAGSASAQGANRFAFKVGGGFTEPVRNTDGRLNVGFNLGAGAGVNLTSWLGVMGEFGFNDLNLSNAALSAAGVPGGSTRIYSLTLNPVVRFNPHGRFDAYLTGGGGYYRRTVEFTEPTVGTITAFDPFYGIFYPINVPATNVLASLSQNKGGVNVGGGVSFRLRGDSNAKFFAEARYHYLYTTPVRTTILPVTFGFSW